MKLAAALLAAAAALGAAPPAGQPAAAQPALSPAAAKGPPKAGRSQPRRSLAGDLEACRQAVDADLARLEPAGELAGALLRSALLGRRLRLLLDPWREENRSAAAALRRQGAELRWRPAPGPDAGWLRLDADPAWAWRWEGQGSPRRLSEAAAAARFEAAWAGALEQLPERLRLDEQLKALPDPRVKDPHYKKRRQAAP